MNLKNSAEIIKRENYDGKLDSILVLQCTKCQENENKFNDNKECNDCVIENLYFNKDKKFEYIRIGSKKLYFDTASLFLGYFKKLKTIKRNYRKIEEIKEKCKFQGLKCKIFTDFLHAFKIEDEAFINPVLIYENFLEKLDNIRKRKTLDSVCEKCLSSIERQIDMNMKILESLEIIDEYLHFMKQSSLFSEKFSFYDYLFNKESQIVDKPKKKGIYDGAKKVIEVYNIGDNELFQILISNIKDEFERIYEVRLSFDSIADKDYFKKITDAIFKDLSSLDLVQKTSIEDLIKLYRQQSIRAISSSFDMPKKDIDKITFYTALRAINLDKIFPLLIDDNIEEIFLDSPEDKIYLNHQKYGRCRTKIQLTLREIQRMKTLLRLYSSQRLDYTSPSIKYVMKNKYFFCRFAIDAEPVHIDNFALDIRKLNKNILTIQDLLKNGTLDPLMAAFLYFNILRRTNITATGETDTGKTTLINAFDLLTPKEFRKIYVENVTESLEQREYGKHQLKYRADSLDTTNEKYSKSNYIKTLLHRTPDLIFLGEILTKEEAEAMFHCLAAGLRGFQTIHSNTIDSLINRFLYHFNISLTCLNDLDIIVLLKKDHFKRRIVSISEINIKNFEEDRHHQVIFQYNSSKKTWDNLISLYETNTVGKLKKFEDLSEEKFNTIIRLYKNIFEYLMIIEKISNKALTDLFHSIAYFSISSIAFLQDFWNNWKKMYPLKAKSNTN